MLRLVRTVEFHTWIPGFLILVSIPIALLVLHSAPRGFFGVSCFSQEGMREFALSGMG